MIRRLRARHLCAAERAVIASAAGAAMLILALESVGLA